MAVVVVASLLWAAALFRFARSRARPHAGALRALTIALFAIAVAATMNVPAAASAVKFVLGWPNATAAIQDAAVVVTAAGNQVMLLHLDRGSQLRPAAVRYRWCAAATVCAAVFLLVLAAGRGPVASTAAFGTGVGATGWLGAARVVAYLYALPVLVEVVLLCRRQATRTNLGIGVAVLGVGAGFTLLAVLLRLVYLVARALVVTTPSIVYVAGSAALDLGGLLIALSTVLAPVAEWVRGRVDLRTLTPVWTAVVAAQPQAVSRSPRVRGAAATAEHRVVQIQDGLYLMALTRGSAVTSTAPPEFEPPRAAVRIAAWVADPKDQGVSLDMFAAPGSLLDADWVRLIAEAYRRIKRTSALETAQ